MRGAVTVTAPWGCATIQAALRHWGIRVVRLRRWKPGHFVATLKDLAPATTYHLRAYATKRFPAPPTATMWAHRDAGRAPTADEKTGGFLWRKTPQNGDDAHTVFLRKNNPTSFASVSSCPQSGVAAFGAGPTSTRMTLPMRIGATSNTGDALLDLAHWMGALDVLSVSLHLPVFLAACGLFGDFQRR